MIELKNRLKRDIFERVRERFPLEPADIELAPTPNQAMGDLALAFPLQLAKKVKANPRKIAQEVARPRRPARRRHQGRDRRGRVHQPVPRPEGLFPGTAPAAGASGLAPEEAEDHHRAHEHQPQQGRPHRPLAERRSRATRSPAACGSRARTSRSRTTSTTRASRSWTSFSAFWSSRRRAWPTSRRSRASSIITAGTSTPGFRPTSPTHPEARGPQSRDHEGESSTAGARRRQWPATFPGGSSGPIWRP